MFMSVKCIYNVSKVQNKVKRQSKKLAIFPPFNSVWMEKEGEVDLEVIWPSLESKVGTLEYLIIVYIRSSHRKVNWIRTRHCQFHLKHTIVEKWGDAKLTYSMILGTLEVRMQFSELVHPSRSKAWRGFEKHIGRNPLKS